MAYRNYLKSQALSFRKETQEEYKARLEQQKLEEARKQDIEYQEYLHYRDKYLTLKEKFD